MVRGQVLPGAQLLLALLWPASWRSNTAPGQLLLPTGCSVVVIPIIGIIKMIFFPVGVSWPPLESDSIQAVLDSCSLLREKDM